MPLDYDNTDVGTTVVAFIRLDAANGTGQDILFNPGGPGGSGIESALGGLGDKLIEKAGGLYNFVSFDPRGVNNSGIALTCYADNPELGGTIAVDPNGTPYEQYAMAVAIGEWCTKANNDSLVKYAGTSAVVQDMAHFTSLQAALNGDQNPEEAEIWFYGGSYGTVVGHTLAALYPKRVGRVIVDGNVNSEEYYNGYATRSFENTDKGFEWFFGLCAEVGPEDCAFAGNSSTAGDVKLRFDTLLARLELAPQITTEGMPAIVTKMHLLEVIFHMLYQPVLAFPVLAEILSGLEQGNATAWIKFENMPPDSYEGPFNYTDVATNEALILIRSIDASGRGVIKSADDYIRLRSRLQLLSAYDGLVLAYDDGLTTVGMGIIPPESQFFYGTYLFLLVAPATPKSPRAFPLT